MRLRSKVVYLIRPNRLHKLVKRRPIGEIAIYKLQPHIFFVRVLIDMVDPSRIERRRPPHHAVNLVALRQQQFGQIRTILARNSGYKSPLANFRWIKSLRHILSLLRILSHAKTSLKSSRTEEQKCSGAADYEGPPAPLYYGSTALPHYCSRVLRHV